MGDLVKFHFSLMLCISIHFEAVQLKGPDGFVGEDIITISGVNTKEKDTREQMPEEAPHLSPTHQLEGPWEVATIPVSQQSKQDPKQSLSCPPYEFPCAHGTS